MESMIEEKELMVPLASISDCSVTPTLRKAHFLKPVLDPTNESLPRAPSFSTSSKFITKILKGKVAFRGRPMPQENWHLWAGNLQEIHQCTWKKVGIFDAIRASTYNLMWDNELIYGLAENWCHETNTFVFPWGESTITLEDVMILGGFSVLGSYVNSVLDTGNELFSVFLEIKGNSQKIFDSDWMDYFIDIGGELEHMAFLALWLSRFVFSTGYYGAISPYVMPIAVALAKGTKTALAPAVLASIYRDLSLLKGIIVGIVDERGYILPNKVFLYAPFQIVQLWGWERFPTLCPKPITLFLGEPRLARWQNLEKLKVKSSIMEFETLGEGFLWRPYALPVENWEFPAFYCDEERWVVLNSDVREEFFTFARCLSSCELVGLDCIEQYLPHRVARQFGLDQNIPSSTPRLNGSMELAWSTYDNPLDSVTLYLSPRLFIGDVSVGYFDWYSAPFNHHNISFSVYRRRHNLSSHPISKWNLKLRKNIGGVEEDNTELSPDCSTSLHGVPLASCSVSVGEIQCSDVVTMLSCDKNHFDNSENIQCLTLDEVPTTSQSSHQSDGLTEHNIEGVPCLEISCHASVVSPTLVEVSIPARFDLNTDKRCIEAAPCSKNVSSSVSPKSPMTEKNTQPQKLDGKEKNCTQEALPCLHSFNADMNSCLIDNIAGMCIETYSSSENNVLNKSIAEEAVAFPTSELVVKKAVIGIDTQIENLDNCDKHCGNNMSGNKRASSVTEMHNEAVPSSHKSISPSKSHDNTWQGIPSQSLQTEVVNEVGSSINSTMKDISKKHSTGAQPMVKALAEDENVSKIDHLTKPNEKDHLTKPDEKKKICFVSAHDEKDQTIKYGKAKYVKGSMDEPVIISDDDVDNDDEDDWKIGDVNAFIVRDSKLQSRIYKLERIISRLKV